MPSHQDLFVPFLQSTTWYEALHGLRVVVVEVKLPNTGRTSTNGKGEEHRMPGRASSPNAGRASLDAARVSPSNKEGMPRRANAVLSCYLLTFTGRSVLIAFNGVPKFAWIRLR